VEITVDDPVPALALVTSSDGGVYFFSPGFGPYLRGPAAADRAAADPAFALDADKEGARPSDPVRTDARRRVVELPAPEVVVSRPRDETWTAGYLAPFPGLDDLPAVPELATATEGESVTVPAGEGANFASPIAVKVEVDPALSDRIVPVVGTIRCAGYPITAVAADGRSLTVQRVRQTEAICAEPNLPLAVVPSDETPWWLDGTFTGFAGRLPADGGEVWAGDARLFKFTPKDFGADVDQAPGATWSFTTDDGFTRYGAFPTTDFQLPADIDAWLRSPPSADGGADWRVFVPYSGGEALIEFDPDAPPPLSALRAFQ
jgi:hypothetical protein